MFSDEEVNRHNYQIRFQEMETKIRKCELERTQLEQRFSHLMRERQECEKAAERSMKLKYKRMIKLERQRAERNESLLRMLNKIDQQAASLAAKSDRLKMLKTQYESYLIRSWSSQRALPLSPAPSICSHQCITPAPPQLSYFPPRNTDSPKSEFVRYLSDMAHTQTAIHNPIPPPTALSSYISAQPNSSTWSRDPFSRPIPSEVIPQPSFSFPTSSSINPPIPETPRRRPPSTKPQLSNEEFIQYIDNEILKAPDVPIVETPPPPMLTLPHITIDPPIATPSPLPTAYLEDVTNEEEAPPSTEYDDDKAYVIEDVAGAVEQLGLYEDATPKLEDTEITQRWERIVEVNSSVLPTAPTVQEVEKTEAQPASESEETEQQQVEQYMEAPSMSYEHTQNSVAEEVQQEVSVSFEHVPDSATSEEVQQEYQANLAPEVDYPPYQAEASYPAEVEKEYQAPVDYNYQYAAETQPTIQAVRQTVKPKPTVLAQSRTPETIEEVANNGEAVEPIVEPRSTPSGSKRSSPMGEHVSVSEIHHSRPESVLAEQLAAPTEYDYAHYPQEFNAPAEQQQDYQYQQDGSDQQQYYDYQQQDPSQQQQQQPYQEYAEGEVYGVDPNQYQQATEYPGPTQYVFEQSYYDQTQQPEVATAEQYDPNQQAYYDQSQQPATTTAEDQQAYYDQSQQPTTTTAEEQQVYYDPNAEQQYYEEQQQTTDQAYYDQSQEYANYEVSQSEGQEVVAEQPETTTESPVKEPETDSSSKTEAATPATEETASPSLLFATSEESEKKDEGKVMSVEEETKEGSGKEEGKDTTTVSSVNDESDFDFSTQ